MTTHQGYEILNIGALDQWRSFYGGFRPESSRDGRRVIDHEMNMQYIGMTSNALAPGEDAGYWHDHTQVEEVYVFLEGKGELALGDDVIEVGPGSVVRVGQGIMRAWRCTPDSPTELKWLCIRAGGTELPEFPNDGIKDTETPMPWA